MEFKRERTRCSSAASLALVASATASAAACSSIAASFSSMVDECNPLRAFNVPCSLAKPHFDEA